MLLPALANILQAQAQQAQQQQQQHSPNSSDDNLPALSPGSLYQQKQNQNDTATNGGMHSSSSFGSLLGMNTVNNNGLNNGFSASSPVLGAVGDPVLTTNGNCDNNKLSVSVDYQKEQQQNHNLSAPCTPHGHVSLCLQGLMRRSTSDNTLPGTPTTSAANGLGPAGMPTSGRRLPIFSTLVEGDVRNQI
jgi:hypothetical protein